jgi:K+-sensing histidine kinase KdpD
MMHKVYSVNIETKDSVIVFELDKPITMGVLSNIIDNNYSSSSEIISIDIYAHVVSDVE